MSKKSLVHEGVRSVRSSSDWHARCNAVDFTGLLTTEPANVTCEECKKLAAEEPGPIDLRQRIMELNALGADGLRDEYLRVFGSSIPIPVFADSARWLLLMKAAACTGG